MARQAGVLHHKCQPFNFLCLLLCSQIDRLAHLAKKDNAQDYLNTKQDVPHKSMFAKRHF